MRPRGTRVSLDREARWTPAPFSRILCQSRSQLPKLGRTVTWLLVFATTITHLLLAHAVHAQENDSTASATIPARPAILPNRWEEDWSVLADPRVPRELLDTLKYIPLSPDDPKTYLSLGADFRERFEANDTAGFGTGPNRNNDYVISRSDVFADLRIADQVQVFAQLQSDFAPWKTMIAPPDQDYLGLEQAFVTITEPVGDGTAKVRLGRQQMNFDFQRFVSDRDGPNVRQSFDAVWGDYQNGPWKFITFYSQPVQIPDMGENLFGDYSSGGNTFSVVRVQRDLSGWATLSSYYAYYALDNAKYLSVAGDERRDSIDVRFAAKTGGFDGDFEVMTQSGNIGSDTIRAWAVGSLSGYTFADIGWTPRVGFQFDAASGDSNPHDNVLQTFNPLFPNGYYFTLAGYTGYTNLIHVKPSIAVHPTSSLTVTFAVARQWRETTADAVYVQGSIPVPGTAGQPGRYTGTYGQLDLNWAITSRSSFAIQAVRFDVGDAIRQAGGHDSDYLGVQIAYGL
jgi:Alginate export